MQSWMNTLPPTLTEEHKDLIVSLFTRMVPSCLDFVRKSGFKVQLIYCRPLQARRRKRGEEKSKSGKEGKGRGGGEGDEAEEREGRRKESEGRGGAHDVC